MKWILPLTVLFIVGCGSNDNHIETSADYPYEVVAVETEDNFELTLLEDNDIYYQALTYIGEEKEVEIISSSSPFVSSLHVSDDVISSLVGDVKTEISMTKDEAYTEEVLLNDNINKYDEGLLEVAAEFRYEDQSYQLQVEEGIE
ncbi:hypothetical protein [Salsuginibacillus kocurii]|uniref:hypothetical protein n=1 Tax=Salsuginibacillus kocurii TaxID=427078 RepID=UPI0003609A42|nr:hypothetical protein [Salsuginibacillus kocurii]